MTDPTVISYFDSFEGPNEWAVLSNFYVGPEPLLFRGRAYRTGEHLFQALKATTKRDHDAVQGCATPAEAKQQGKHMLRLRPDWERVKYDAMRLVLEAKFRLGREEGPLLLATGDALLVEGTMWGDRVWGVDLKRGRLSWCEDNGEIPANAAWEPGTPWDYSPGRNWLGTLLMARRCELVAQQVDPRRRLGYDETEQYVLTLPPPPAR
jgi:ribA/ribD-fused uncharacterized protein